MLGRLIGCGQGNGSTDSPVWDWESTCVPQTYNLLSGKRDGSRRDRYIWGDDLALALSLQAVYLRTGNSVMMM